MVYKRVKKSGKDSRYRQIKLKEKANALSESEVVPIRLLTFSIHTMANKENSIGYIVTFLILSIHVVINSTIAIGATNEAKKEKAEQVRDVAERYVYLHSVGAMWTEKGRAELEDVMLERETYTTIHGEKYIVLIDGYRIGRIDMKGAGATVEVCREVIGYIKYFAGFPAGKRQPEFVESRKIDSSMIHLTELEERLFSGNRVNRWVVKTQSMPHVKWEQFIANTNNIYSFRKVDNTLLINLIDKARKDYASSKRGGCQ